jgi:hypothetical protein
MDTDSHTDYQHDAVEAHAEAHDDFAKQMTEEELLARLAELRGIDTDVLPSPPPEPRDSRVSTENVPLRCPQGHTDRIIFVSMIECRIEVHTASLKKGRWVGDRGHITHGPIGDGIYRCAECGWEDPNVVSFHPDPDAHLSRGVLSPEEDMQVSVSGNNVLGAGAPSAPSPEAINPNSMKQTYGQRAAADAAKIEAAKARAEAEAAARDA